MQEGNYYGPWLRNTKYNNHILYSESVLPFVYCLQYNYNNNCSKFIIIIVTAYIPCFLLCSCHASTATNRAVKVNTTRNTLIELAVQYPYSWEGKTYYKLYNSLVPIIEVPLPLSCPFLSVILISVTAVLVKFWWSLSVLCYVGRMSI